MSYFYGQIGPTAGLNRYYYGEIGPTSGLGAPPSTSTAQYNERMFNTTWTMPADQVRELAIGFGTGKFASIVRQLQRTFNIRTSNNLQTDGKLGPVTKRRILDADVQAAIQPPEGIKAVLQRWVDLDAAGDTVSDLDYLKGLWALRGIRERPARGVPTNPIIPTAQSPVAYAGTGSAGLFALAAILGYAAWRTYDYNKTGKWSYLG